MNLVEGSLFILFLAALSAPFAEKLHVPVEVFLLLGSCALSLLPGLPSFEVDPYIAFGVFLPPILFHAAYFTSWRDFKKNRRPIAFLAIGLVLFTAAVVACVAKILFPNFSWSEGFLLGAIISPPDASAATSIVKKLGAPRRLITVLEGESLVNDATALVIYRFALGAIIIGSFSLSEAIGQFFYISIGGLVVGYTIGIAFFTIIKKISDSHAQTILSVITAFACYIIAEKVGVSGIISTVVGGLYFGRRFPELNSGKTRIETMSAWKNIIFIVNGFIFTLIGFQLPIVLKNLQPYNIGNLILAGIYVSITVIIVRMVWVFAATYIPWYLFPKRTRTGKEPQWQLATSLGWIGMRGIISLAAVLAIPTQLAGEPFPNRGIFIFITYCVILVTLITPAITVPSLFKFFKFKSNSEKLNEEASARKSALEGVLNKISSWEHSKRFPKNLIDDCRTQINRKINVIKAHSEANPYSHVTDEYHALRRINREMVESERAILFQLRREGKIHDEIFHLLSEELDMEEMRIKTLRI